MAVPTPVIMPTVQSVEERKKREKACPFFEEHVFVSSTHHVYLYTTTWSLVIYLAGEEAGEFVFILGSHGPSYRPAVEEEEMTDESLWPRN